LYLEDLSAKPILIKENKEPIKYICFVENGNNLLTIYEKKLIFWEIKAN
jgi:hypothetical protein